MSKKTFKNPLNQDEKNTMLKLSAFTAKNKAFNPYERRIIYFVGKHSDLFVFLFEKIPGLMIALVEWCKEKKLDKFYKKSKTILEKFERLEKNLKPVGLKKLTVKQIIKKADKLKEEGNDDSDIKAYELYYEAAEKGDGYAQSTIGEYFYNGKCYKWNHKYKKPEPNYNEAVSWYEKSIKNQYPDAFANLAYCFIRGEGVEQNPEKGIELLEKANELGEDWVLEHLIQTLVLIVIEKIEFNEDVRSEKIKLQKYIQASKKYLYGLLKIISTNYDDVSDVELYKLLSLELSKTLAIGAFMEGDSDENKKESKQFLKKSGYENNQKEIEHIDNNLKFSELIFSSNVTYLKKVISKEQKKIIPLPNSKSIEKHRDLQGYRSIIDEERDWIKKGEGTNQEFKDRIFFTFDIDVFNNPVTKEDKNYKGATKNNKAHGKGTYIFPDGEKYKKYTGEWKDGLKHGHGTLIRSDEKKIVGEFKNGYIKGKEVTKYSEEKYKKKVQCSTAIEIAKKICGFLNNTSVHNNVIRLGITDDSKPAGIKKDIEFFKKDGDSDSKTKEKIKRNLLNSLSRLLPEYNSIECDYKKFKGTTYLNLIIKNKFKNPGMYITTDEKIFNSANLYEKEKKYDPNKWDKFFIRKGDDTTTLSAKAAHDHKLELEVQFGPYLK